MSVERGVFGRFRLLEWLCVWCVVLACQNTKPDETPRAAPSLMGSVAPKKHDPPPVPVEQELLQVQPSDIRELTWGQDGETYALASSSDVWLYRVATRTHTAVLPAERVASVSGGGFVGLSEPERIPTIWNDEGDVMARLPVAAQIDEDEGERSLLVNRSGVLAVLVDRRTKTFTTWDLVRRRVVATFSSDVEQADEWHLSESGRFLARSQPGDPSRAWVAETSTGAKVELGDELEPHTDTISALAGKEGFLFEGDGYFEVLLEPMRTRRIDLPKTIAGRPRLLGDSSVLVPLVAGLGVYNRAARKLMTVLANENDEGVVSDDGKYFVSSWYDKSGWPDYRVRSSRDGALVAKLAATSLWAFRPRSREVAVGAPEGLMLLDVSSQHMQAIAPSARLLRFGDVGVDERQQLCAVAFAGDLLAIVSLGSGKLLHSIQHVKEFHWLDSARLAVKSWDDRGRCRLSLLDMTEYEQTRSELSCDGAQAWQFSTDPGFLLLNSAVTPKIAEAARQFGIARPNGVSAGWVVEKRAFDALDREGDWLSVRVNRDRTIAPVRGPDPPPRDSPPYTQQLLRLPDGGAIRLDGEAHFTWYDARGVARDLHCTALETPTATDPEISGKELSVSVLFPRGYGDVRFNRRGQLLFSHRRRPVLADFRTGACRQFPATADAPQYPRREVAQLARNGAWLATISPGGLFILHDLQTGSQRQLQLRQGLQSVAASSDDRIVVVSDDRQTYFVNTRSFRWLRLRWLSKGGPLLPLYDSSDGRFDGSEEALKTVLLRVTRAGEPPKLFDLSEYETHFGVVRRDANLVRTFFAEARATK